MADTMLVEAPAAALAPDEEPSKLGTMLRELLHSGTGLVGALVLSVVTLSAVLAPVITPHDPTQQDLSSRLQPPLLFGGTAEHVLGTDQLGRDLLSRLLQGARLSMLVAL